MAALVWLLMLYSIATVTLLAQTGGIPPSLSMIYCTLQAMALACHAKTSFTDPGSVPKSSVPVELQRQFNTSHSMCGQCQTFKPLMSHHCRICNRCVSKMDHHCPWMNNCVGAANLSEFILYNPVTVYLHQKGEKTDDFELILRLCRRFVRYRAFFSVLDLYVAEFLVRSLCVWVELFHVCR